MLAVAAGWLSRSRRPYFPTISVQCRVEDDREEAVANWRSNHWSWYEGDQLASRKRDGLVRDKDGQGSRCQSGDWRMSLGSVAADRQVM